MSLWRKRNVHHNGQNQPKWFNMTALANNDLSIKSEEAMREVQRLGQEIEQEPVAWMYEYWDDHHDSATGGQWRKNMTRLPLDLSNCRNVEPLYTTPQQRTWVGLTPEEIDEIIENSIDKVDALIQTMDKLKEKNT